MRNNPLIYRNEGLIVPNDSSNLWFHGSEDPYETLPRTQFSSPGTVGDYDATFFTPSQAFAESFAERYLVDGEKRGGFVYACRVKDVKIFDVDNIFENMEDPNTSLTEEGARFLARLSQHSDEANTVMRSLRTGDWGAFHIYDSVDYDAVINTMKDLGYRGWVEFENRLANLALMYPEDDVEIMWSYRVGGDRENPSAEYTLISASEMEDPDEFEYDYEINPETVDPWKVVFAVNLGVSSRKEFYAGHLFNGQLVSALFVAPTYDECFSFDVAVLPEHQAKGLGAELVDEAIEVFEEYELFKDEDFEYCVHVVNPYMKSLLERKGFQVIESTSSDDEWIMDKVRRNPQNLYSPDGYLINPNTNDTVWWHGDVAGSLYRTSERFLAPAMSQERIEDTHAAFFTSDEKAAQFFALRGFSDIDEMLEEYEDVEPTVWAVRIRAQNLYGGADQNPDFSNYASPEFTDRLKREGYDGWWEQDTKSLAGIWNVALLYPERDVEVLGGYECRWRNNPQNLPIYVNSLGVHTNAPIPLYHATTAADAIIEEGFKTPDELPYGSFGLGSSGLGLISMTGDHRYAEAICVHMATHARIGIGDLRWSDLMADFRRVSPKRYQAIVDGTDHGNKAANLIRVLKVMDKGQVPVNRGMFGEDMSLALDPERYELVSMEEYVEYMREYCVSKNFEHMIDIWTNPAKGTLADLYNELLWINDGTIENPVGDSYLWKRFLGKDLSILDQIAYVRADLNPDMRIVSRSNSVEMPSVFYSRSGEFSVDEYGVQKLKRGKDLNPSRSWGGYRAPTPLPESETGLTFDVDSEFVDRVPAEDYNKFAIFLFAEDEFRLPAPRDQLTPAVLEGTAMDILEVLPDLWQGKDVTCFYPHIGEKRKTLLDNLYS
jgi:ribosomal protein S18 acetylase RimI-like enzyme